MNTTTETARPVISRASELAAAAHADGSPDCLGYYDPETGADLIHDADDLPVLFVADVVDAGEHVGFTAHIPLEALTWIGLDVETQLFVLELTGSREEIAKAAALFSEIGTKLQAHVDALPEAEDSLEELPGPDDDEPVMCPSCRVASMREAS